MRSFFFYDLETSGFSPASDRIMQFAGRETNNELEPINEPINLLVKLSDDILPSPEAVLVHGITPQKTFEEGFIEPRFLKLFHKAISKKNLVITGYNSIRFDDEFMRYTLYRNLYDPYEWQWKDGRSRWDLLDVGRMMRALRPGKIKWPVNEDGTANNRLQDLAKANNIVHKNAHDALSDVEATIGLAKLFHSSQPKLFDFLLKNRDKRSVDEVIGTKQPKPFVYSSGRYPKEYLKTTVAVVLGPHPTNSNGRLVYDLRYDPSEFSELSLEELKGRLFMSAKERESTEPLPVKVLSIGKSPAVAPLGTLDEAAQERIGLGLETIKKHFKKLAETKGFAQLVYDAYKEREEYELPSDPEAQLYGGFIGDKDKQMLGKIINTPEKEIANLHPEFIDERLPELFFRYKARNYPKTLSQSEAKRWELWRTKRLTGQIDIGGLSLKEFLKELARLAKKYQADEEKLFLLKELQLYAESIAPVDIE